jgi:hypothetical protein
MNTVRTQIYLRKDQHHLLRDEAHRLGVSLTELMRRAIDGFLTHSHGLQKRRPMGLSAIVGLGNSGLSDGSTRYADYGAEGIREKLQRRIPPKP